MSDVVTYSSEDGIATITINRADKYNAFRGQTCEELIDAFNRAGWDKSVGVIVLSGAGTMVSSITRPNTPAPDVTLNGRLVTTIENGAGSPRTYSKAKSYSRPASTGSASAPGARNAILCLSPLASETT